MSPAKEIQEIIKFPDGYVDRKKIEEIIVYLNKFLDNMPKLESGSAYIKKGKTQCFLIPDNPKIQYWEDAGWLLEETGFSILEIRKASLDDIRRSRKLEINEALEEGEGEEYIKRISGMYDVMEKHIENELG